MVGAFKNLPQHRIIYRYSKLYNNRYNKIYYNYKWKIIRLNMKEKILKEKLKIINKNSKYYKGKRMTVIN